MGDGRAVRLAEGIAALSMATDLGMGQAMEHALRTCLLAVRLGVRLGLDSGELRAVYYVALLRRIGCTADSHELGKLFGDDLAAHARVFTLDFSSPVDLISDMLRHAGVGQPPWQRLRTLAEAIAAGPEVPATLFRASCEVAQSLASQLGFEEPIAYALGYTFERWDGRGLPNHAKGEAIPLAARLADVAEHAVVVHRLAGTDGAVGAARRRAGVNHDPALVELFCREASTLLHGLDREPIWDAVLDAEPEPREILSEARLDSLLHAMAYFADLKSLYAANHSTGVAELVASAAAQVRSPEAEVTAVRRAALVHDLGRAAVPNSIWEKAARLSDGEWEQVRLHPYYTERILARVGGLARIGSLAGMHHERLDGSGYYRAAGASQIPFPARLLAAADSYHALTEPRPYRPPMTPDRAADELHRQVLAGRIDGEAADAVLRAAGHRVRRRRTWPAGLTPREIEVLRLVARGRSNRQIAGHLVISEPTVAHHVQNIYAKIGAATRAGATLFAMQHALLETNDMSETWLEQTMPHASPGA